MSKLDSGGSFSEQKNAEKQQRQKRAVKATHLLFWPIREKANFWTKNPRRRPAKAVRGCSSFEFEMWIKESGVDVVPKYYCVPPGPILSKIWEIALGSIVESGCCI